MRGLFFLMKHAYNESYVLHTCIQSCMVIKESESKKKRPFRRSDSNVRRSVAAIIGTFQHIADWLKRQSKTGLNCVIAYISGSLVNILMIP